LPDTKVSVFAADGNAARDERHPSFLLETAAHHSTTIRGMSFHGKDSMAHRLFTPRSRLTTPVPDTLIVYGFIDNHLAGLPTVSRRWGLK